ncbi:MAG: carboxypeptidase regulatory-like domain-containing protein, partial [Proteobacteria bacterium]|nr:carboxypeptidase regulatory-like domain-containing protein [Pseudomonadota bacterium]
MTTLIISVSSSATNAAGTAYGQQPDQLAPSFFDMKVTSSTNPVIGTGVYDAYCINPLLDIFVAPTSYAADSYEASNPTSFQQITPIEADLSSLSQAQVDQLNWILSQNLTSDPKYAGRFNYGEVQVAIWRVLGFTQAEINSAGLDRFLNDNNRQVVSLTDVDFLVNAAQSAVASGQYVSPPPGTNFTMLVDPSPKTGTETGTGIQPLIVQLANAKLGNFVWFDSDADGLQDANESGVDNLVVELWKDGVKVASTVTGDDFSTAAIEHGFYQFAGLAAGDYQVKFVAPDYAFTSVDANLNSQDQEDSDANPATGFSQVVHLNAGESNQTIDAGLVAPGTAKISGYVYEDQGNDGVRNAEPPIAGVTVTLNGTDDLGNAVNATTTTDANGYYEFTGLRPGTYAVTERSRPTTSTQHDTPRQAAEGGRDQLISAIPLAAGEHSQENNFGNGERGQLSGYVYEDQGNDGVRNAEPPIAGVTITLSGVDDLGNAVNATTTTDANGYYEFTGLRPGTYSVTETQPANYLDGKDTAGSTGGSATNDLISAIPLAAGEHSQENNFGELPPAKLSGYVYEDQGNDGVRNAEPPIAGVTVTLSGTDDLGNAVTASTTTDVNGYYEFTGLRPGTYSVTETQPANYLDGKDTAGSTGGSATNDLISAIPLAAGEHSQENNFGELPPAKLSGYVYEDQGNDGVRNAEPPIAGVTITLSGTDDLGNAVNATTTTDANGYYEFTDLRPGTYSVTETQPANYLDGKDTAGSTGGSATNDLISAIPLAAGEHSQENNFGELPPAKLSGYVYEDQGNDGVRNAEPPIAGVTVTLNGTDDLGNAVTASTTTDANGYYEFTDLRPGTYSVTETQPANYLDGKDTAGSTGGSVSNDLISAISLAAGQHSQENNFGELPPAKISGYVYEDQGNDGVRNAEPPIAGVTITLSGTDDLGNAVNATTTTDANGYYEFTDLRPGTYAVTETQPGGYIDGKDTVGTAGGSNAVNDTLSAIVLVGGTNSVENNFGELKTASLGDRVWYDTNANGQQDFGETGANGVTVTLTAGGADGQLSTTADNTTQTTTTAGDGNYLFT